MTSSRPLRRLVASAVLAGVLLPLSACGDEPAPAPTIQPTEETPEEAASAAFRDYWDVYVQMSNSGEVNRAAFDGIADGPFLEPVLNGLSSQADDGVVRVGEPSLGQFTATVDGDSATSTTCYSEREWGARHNGEDVPPPPDTGNAEKTAILELRDGDWIVTDIETTLESSCTVN